MFRKAMLILCIFALLAACGEKKAAPTATPMPPTNTLPPPTEPPAPAGPYPLARALAHFVYDPISDQAWMYGGMLSIAMGASLTEGWAFDAKNLQWAGAMGIPLGCGYSSAMVYDSHAERILLYCPGTMQGASVKVWEYDPKVPWVWTDRKAANIPTGSASPRMVYDAESRKTIIVGGISYETWEQFNETWAYDYDTNTWTKMNPQETPPGLYAHDMAYDAESDRVILWGGSRWAGIDKDGNWLSEHPENLVWAYDYNTGTWESFPVTNGPELPPNNQALQTIQAVYIPDLDRTYFYWDDQLWAYDLNNNAWEKAKGDLLSGGGNRVMHCIVYLPSIQRLLVYGGADVGINWDDLTFNNETWLYDPKTGEWTQAGP